MKSKETLQHISANLYGIYIYIGLDPLIMHLFQRFKVALGLAINDSKKLAR